MLKLVSKEICIFYRLKHTKKGGICMNNIQKNKKTKIMGTLAKLALILCIALDKKFEELFYFD